MASPANSMMVFLGICMMCLTGLGSALRIVTQPQIYSEKTEELNISCITNGTAYLTRTIYSIQILKESEETIAVIDLKQDLKMGTGSKKNMKAEGHVDTADASKSRLTLTIENPTLEDAGIYRCRVFFTDESHSIVEEHVARNITFYEHDITGTFEDLAQKVSALLTKVQDLNQENTKKQKQLDMLVKAIQKIELQLKNMAQKLLALSNTPVTTRTDPTMAVTSLTTTSSPEKTVCPDEGWTFYKEENKCLKVFGRFMSWSSARQSCQSLGGDLVIIRDDSKLLFVGHMVRDASYGNPWIGVKNHATLGFYFKYVDGSEVQTYHPWFSSPNGSKDDDYKCVMLQTSPYYSDKNYWADTGCSGTHPYVCSV